MQNHVKNTMQFRKRSCNEGLQSYRGFYAQNALNIMEKDRKKRIFILQVLVKKANYLAHFDD